MMAAFTLSIGLINLIAIIFLFRDLSKSNELILMRIARLRDAIEDGVMLRKPGD